MEQQEQANAVQLPMTPEATSAVLAVRYAVDADFRAAFDKDPKAAIAKACGQELPSDVEIVVHRNEDKRWNITLPAMETDGALGDRDMANVAGGVAGAAAMSLIAATPAICAAACAGIPPQIVALTAATGMGGASGPAGLAAAGMAVGIAAAAVQAGAGGGNDG